MILGCFFANSTGELHQSKQDKSETLAHIREEINHTEAKKLNLKKRWTTPNLQSN